ncbi:MAG: tRNA lysidine(34) synthetase TilS [Deltaproteobacteria bacterium]|nr:tRNA lysidine(34) synthetase TilS [Deltaproteobacteria bacterium]
MTVDIVNTLELELKNISADEKTGFLLGCSGGADSTALLHAFCSLIHLNLHFEVCTVNHGIREEGAKDAQFVEKICAGYGIRCHTVNGDLGVESSEDKAREFRHSSFQAILEKEKLDYIVLAHNSDDQAETILMRIIRGTGIRGLKGMGKLDGNIFRPFLGISRDEILFWLMGNSHMWHEDITNQKDIYFRNRVRNTLFPLMEKENSGIKTALINLGKASKESEEIINGVLYNLIENAINLPWGVCIRHSELLSCTPALINEFVREKWREFTASGELSRQSVESCTESILQKKSFSNEFLPGGVRISWLGKFVYIGNEIPDGSMDSVIIGSPEVIVKTPFRGSFYLEENPHGEISVSSFPITVRTRKPGDHIKRMHMGMVSLKSIYASYPVKMRDSLLIFEEPEGKIIWAEGAGKAFGVEGTSYSINWIDSVYDPEFFRM